jgi:diguanylate cyclase (GGDEF)-like protein/PAS domain S-box-containing protein
MRESAYGRRHRGTWNGRPKWRIMWFCRIAMTQRARTQPAIAARWREAPLAVRLLGPFFVLLLVLTVIVGWLTYSAGRKSVDDLSAKLLGSIADRVSEATRERLADADLVLSGLFAKRSDGEETERASLLPFEQNDVLERRFFEATAVRTFAHYIYYARTDGTFIGVERVVDPRTGEQRQILAKIALDPTQPRAEYEITRPGERSRRVPTSTQAYDARTRPWYKRAIEIDAPAWSDVYASFSRGTLLVTHVQPVRSAAGDIRGVLAADVPLLELSRFLGAQDISPNSVAFLVDGAGRLVASSGKENLIVRNADGSASPLAAADSSLALIRESAALLKQSQSYSTAGVYPIQLPGGRVQVAVRPLATQTQVFRGLNWRVVVVAPQSDFTAEIVANNRYSATFAIFALLLVLLLGAILLRSVARDIHDLAAEADRLGEGQWPDTPPPPRGGEVGQITTAFYGMAWRLKESQQQIQQKNDELGAANRELEHRVQQRTQELEERNLSLAREIVERKRVEFSLRELSSAVEQAADGMMVLDADGTVRYANPAYERITGYAPSELVGHLLPAFESAKVLGGPLREIHELMAAGRDFHGVVLSRRKSGEGYYAEKTVTPIHDDEGDIRAYAWIERDVSEREQEREQLEQRLTMDALTGLYNRESIVTKLRQALMDAKNRRVTNMHVGVVFMDLDGFKSVNDRFGHDVGDGALREAARRLKAALRSRDSLARMGGDEFVAVLTDLRDSEGATAVMSKFAEALKPTFVVGSAEFSLGTSMGLAMFPEDDLIAEDLLKHADMLMLADKRARKTESGRERGQAYS